MIMLTLYMRKYMDPPDLPPLNMFVHKIVSVHTYCCLLMGFCFPILPASPLTVGLSTMT